MTFPAAVLIADDLTGSLDSIAPFAAVGLKSLAIVRADALDRALALSPDVLAVNLGTRELGARTARARAGALAQDLLGRMGPDTIWFKKIDSRLKGPIAAEIAGLAETGLWDRLLICPAIPEMGRMVLGGHLWGDGVNGRLPVAATIGAELPGDVPDARSDADLDGLVQTLMPRSLLVGARGLAAALARRLCPAKPVRAAQVRPGPMGIVVGSRDPVTLAQVAELQALGQPEWMAAPDGQLSARPASLSFLVQASAGPGADAALVSQRLAQGIGPSLPGLASLVLTGGETAAAVLKTLAAEVLQVQGEVLPGLPLCQLADPPAGFDLITKSGGFGPADTLLRLWQAAQDSKGHCAT